MRIQWEAGCEESTKEGRSGDPVLAKQDLHSVFPGQNQSQQETSAANKVRTEIEYTFPPGGLERGNVSRALRSQHFC